MANTGLAVVNVRRAIAAFHKDSREHHRYRSWEHCYCYFRRQRPRGLAAHRDEAAFQLGFYLASWGMYRASSFLLRHDYTVHLGVVDIVAEARFDDLWSADFGASAKHSRLIPRIGELIVAIRNAYKPFTRSKGQPTDTLITKIILGTFGCLPACDRYFLAGWKSAGNKYSRLNDRFLARALDFCRVRLPELRREQATIRQARGVRYPLMKLVDMCFWQLGYQRSGLADKMPR